MNKMKMPGWLRSYRVITVLLLSLVLSACDDSGVSTNPDVVTVPVELSAKQQVPTNTSSATASGTLTVNSASGALSGSLTVRSMTVTAAHIHSGKAGTNGGVVVTLDVSGDKVSVPANTTLTSTEITAMLAGGLYVNLHSTAFPGGEIRGQIAPSGIEVMVFGLNGDSEVPPVTGAGNGTAYVTLNRTSSLLDINITTSTNTAAAAAHLHGAFAGENGGVLLALEQDASDTGVFSISSTLDQTVLDAIDAGGTYINVHTVATPSGELRGQVLPAGVSVHSATLSGDQEVPAVVSAGAGNGALTLNSNANKATAIVNTSNVGTATAAHVHTGAVGTNGGVLFGLEKDANNTGVWIARDVSIDAEAISSITAGNTYFNVHTPANPSGEIRGQLTAN